MEILKKIGIILMVIIFPIGILYCVLHTLGKEFTTFLGSLFIALITIGLITWLYVSHQEALFNFFNKIIECFEFLKDIIK